MNRGDKDPFGGDHAGPAGEPTGRSASEAHSREAHAPDPHIVYERHERPERSADAGKPKPGASELPNGPLLLVGDTGVLMASVAAAPASGSPQSGSPGRSPVGATADAPGVALYRFPMLVEPDSGRSAADDCSPLLRIATYEGNPVYAASVRGDRGESAVSKLESYGLEEIGYRELYGTIGDEELGLVSRAIQMVDWDESTHFCSRCGERTTAPSHECVKRCPACDLTQYPRLAPAMIVGVVRDGKLLLGQSPRFRGRFHSILAGFVEPGETAEQCVRREVYEEVGISVRNIRYFGSQPWPFPHSFMLGFTAEYESGELHPDPAEIIHADWYAADELPNVPGEVSISGRIINWFRQQYG